jgi:hypothetical protein
LDSKEVVRLYVEERKTSIEIAKIFNVSIHPIYNIIHKSGVQRTQSEAMNNKWVGDKNPNWKGGKTTFEKWRTSIKYFFHKMKVFKESVKIRDNFKCRMCSSEKMIETHHIISVRDIKEEKDLFDVNNGITLCRKCHLAIHFKENEYIDYFRELIKSSDSEGK